MPTIDRSRLIRPIKRMLLIGRHTLREEQRRIVREGCALPNRRDRLLYSGSHCISPL